MLSRIAESLYWIGRYVERAEDTARLLDVHYHLLLEDRRADEAAVCGALLDAMGADPRAIGGEHDAATVTALLAQDLTFSGSITCSMRRGVGERARRARGALVGAVGDAQHHLPRGREPGPCRHRARPRTSSSAGCATAPPRATGIVDATMSRDDGWRFFSVGRSLERADMTDAPAERALRRRVRAHRVDHDPAELLGVRGVPARVPARGRRRRPRSSSCCSTGCSRGRCSTR